MRSRVEGKQQKAKDNHDHNPKYRFFNIGQRVKVHNFSGREKWVPGTIAEITGRSTYCVNLPNGQRLVHIDQMIRDPTTLPEVVDWEPSDTVRQPEHSEQHFSGTSIEQVPESRTLGSPLPAPATLVSPLRAQDSALPCSPATVAVPDTPRILSPSSPGLRVSRPRRNCGPPKKLDL